jgi:hypothetical protein
MDKFGIINEALNFAMNRHSIVAFYLCQSKKRLRG